jgi:outer membrane protein assembly factor BamB
VNQKQTFSVVLSVLVLALLLFFWRMPHATPTQTSSTASLVKKWEFTGSGIFVGSLALADDGTLYAASDDGFIFALDPTGTLQWKTYIGPTKSSPSVGPDGAIYISTSNGKVYALNHSGVVRWSSEVYGGQTAGQNGSAIGRDDLYIHSGDGLYAMRLSNGQVDWKSVWGGDQWGSVTLLADGTLLSPGRGRLNALDDRGELTWQYPPLPEGATKRNNGYPPPGEFYIGTGMAVGNDRTLYTSVDRTRMVAIGLDGSFKWEFAVKSSQMNFSSPVISTDGTIYYGTNEGGLNALDSSGATKWTLELPNYLRATPVLAQDGSIFVPSGNFLWVISPDGKILSKNPIGIGADASPTLAPDGTIYVATSDGKVMAFDGGHGPLMDSPWPKYQADLANTGNPHTL